ncbi:MAG: hypothetical protein R3B45_07485 [Bdellovibrionota bacterium]
MVEKGSELRGFLAQRLEKGKHYCDSVVPINKSISLLDQHPLDEVY